MRPLTPRERKFLAERLRIQHGVEEAFKGLVLYATGQRRIRATTPETAEVARKLKRVQQVGLYVAKISNGDVALSIEGSQFLNDAIKKNIVELDEESAEKWMRASPIDTEGEVRGRYVVGKLGKLYLGSGRVSRDGKIYPQVAKWRRVPDQKAE